jgi:hypothetical protein
MMHLTLQTLIQPPFQQAFLRLADQPLPAKTAYRLAKTLRVLRAEAEAFEAARQAGIKRHGGGQDIAAGTEAEKAFMAELEELLKKEVELPLEGKVKLGDECRLCPRDLDLLFDLVEAD